MKSQSSSPHVKVCCIPTRLRLRSGFAVSISTFIYKIPCIAWVKFQDIPSGSAITISNIQLELPRTTSIDPIIVPLARLSVSAGFESHESGERPLSGGGGGALCISCPVTEGGGDG